MLLDITPTHGCYPRHFLLLEDIGHIIVAHEKAGGITALRLSKDGTAGELLQRLALPKACFVMKAGGRGSS